jgi:hypothetical protein
MDAVDNFVGAAHEAVKTKPWSEIRAAKEAALRKRSMLHAVGEFLKSFFGPSEPPTVVRVNGRQVNEQIASVIAGLYASLVSARLRLDEVRRECNAELERRRREVAHRHAVERLWAEAEDTVRFLTNAHFALVRRVAALFDAIKHGDAEHQAWLKNAIVAHFAGEPVPPPRKKKK